MRTAVVAGLAVICLALVGVRGLGLFVTALLAGGASTALLAARRANWDCALSELLLPAPIETIRLTAA